MKGKGIFVIIIVVILVIIGSCSKDDSHPGASMDWGPDYFWNTRTNTVERKPWR